MRSLTLCCLLGGAAAAWGCGGCNGLSADPDSRVAPDSLLEDLRIPPDARTPDTGGPDTVPPACGGSRTLKPVAVKRGKGIPCGKGCQQVTFGDSPNEYDVFGNLLVYSGGGGIDRSVYMVDLAKDEEWLVHKPAYPKRPACNTVATDGTRLAYSCTISPIPGDYNDPIQIYDPTTKIEQDLRCWKIDVNKGHSPAWIGLGQQGIVVDMSFKSQSTLDAHFYRFSDDSFTNISQRFGGVYNTRISGDNIVWFQTWDWGAPPYTQIVLYNTHTKKKRFLAPFAGNQYNPRIRGSKVVWVDNRNSPGNHGDLGNSDIYVHDLKTGKTTAACTHKAQQDLPDVEDDRVVWMDWRNNKPTPTPKFMGSQRLNSDIYMKDLKTGKEIQITAFAAKGYKDLELDPRIDRNRVFFRMIYQGGVAVFMIDLKQVLGK